MRAAAEDHGPDELDGDGDAVGARVEAVLGGVDDDGGEHDADGDAELVAGHEGAADLAGALGGVRLASASHGSRAPGEEKGGGAEEGKGGRQRKRRGAARGRERGRQEEDRGGLLTISDMYR